jgi:hypothetical protein
VDSALVGGGFLACEISGSCARLRRLDSNDEGDEVEITEVDEYIIFIV